MEKLENIKTEKDANKTHYDVGAKIRKTIKELGGTMPEELPTQRVEMPKEIEEEPQELFMKMK